MRPDASMLGLLERAVGQVDAIIGRIRPDEGTLPTPCAERDVRALVAHLTGHTMPNFTIAASGGTPDWSAPAAGLPDDWAQAFHAAAWFGRDPAWQPPVDDQSKGLVPGRDPSP